MPRFIKRPTLADEYFNRSAILPLGLTVENVQDAINSTYDFLHDVNAFLVRKGYDRLEDMLLGNSFAGILSEVLVKNLAKHSTTLVRNRYIGGYPDLILRGGHVGDSILRAQEGVEVKTSKQSGGWQGHNVEQGWVIIFCYRNDTTTEPKEKRDPTQIVEVLAANLTAQDWSFSGRGETSRRTITASINQQGTNKLRANAIYRHPDFGVKLGGRSKI